MTKQYPTKQYLSEVISNREFAESVPPEIVIVMARQLLAGMEQEPVYQACKEAGVWVDIEPGDVASLKVNGEQVRALYAAPQLPQPAVVSVASREDFEAWARSAGFNENWYFFTNTHPNHYDDDHINDMWAAWSACRAAMLQGAEPVNQPYTLRDGWVAVPVEATLDMVKAGAKAASDGFLIPGIYRAILASAPDFREISNSSTKHFRENAETSTKCWCYTCRPVTMTDMRFVVCPECGNKRCPRANDCRNVCSGSNEPGQEGSAYPAPQRDGE